MRQIDELQDLYVQIKFGFADWKECVAWAVDRLVHGEEGEDSDVTLLASSIDEDEINELVKKIIQRYLTGEEVDEEYWAGKYVVKLYKQFHEKEIDIFELDSILLKLYNNLDYPDWLVMLSRNCEYATDIPDFVKPFNDEFDYIVELWRSCNSMTEFNNRYDRTISNTHT